MTITHQTEYEKVLNDTYRIIGENSPDMIRRKADEFIRHFKAQSFDREVKLLDLGCGVGLLEKNLFSVDKIGAIFGVDIDFQSYGDQRPGTFPKCRYVQASGCELPFSDNVFDVVIAMCVFHHVPIERRKQLIREIKRVIKPGGLFFVFEHNPFNPITRFFVRMSPIDKGVKLLRLGWFKSIFFSLGFHVVTTQYLIFFPSMMRSLCAQEYRLGFLPLGAQYLIIAKKMAKET